MIAAGVDRSRGRWVWIALDGGAVDGGVAFTIAEVRARVGPCGWIGIDIPLGFSEPPAIGRPCEGAARRLLGSRRSSVFPTLPRECYEAPYEDRNAVVARLGLAHSYSKQAWNLRDGIFDVQRHLDGRMLETHPELAFWARAGGDLAPKRTRAGVAARAELLLGEGVEVGDVSWPAALPVDDVLDAAICAVVARARTRGEARFVPAGVDPELDAVIWY